MDKIGECEKGQKNWSNLEMVKVGYIFIKQMNE